MQIISVKHHPPNRSDFYVSYLQRKLIKMELKSIYQLLADENKLVEKINRFKEDHVTYNTCDDYWNMLAMLRMKRLEIAKVLQSPMYGVPNEEGVKN